MNASLTLTAINATRKLTERMGMAPQCQELVDHLRWHDGLSEDDALQGARSLVLDDLAKVRDGRVELVHG